MRKVLKSPWVFPSHKFWAVFLFICQFMSIVIVVYWQITRDTKDKSRFYSLPRDYVCPFAVPSPSSSDWFSQPPIYFVETSQETTPNFLFMCSVESAARVHPEARIIVLINGFEKDNFTSGEYLAIALLRCFRNVEFRPLDMEDLFKDTPLADWYAVAQDRWEPYFMPILSDACRLAIMWKFGGIYLDTDFIVLKSLKNLTNTLGAQSTYSLNGAFLSFESRHSFIKLCMQDFVDNYNRFIWGHQGPQLFTRVFKKWCSIRSLQSKKSCGGITVLPREAFYPIRWQDWMKFYEAIKASEISELFNSTYAVHVWNQKSEGIHIAFTSETLLGQLNFHYCPSTYELAIRLQ